MKNEIKTGQRVQLKTYDDYVNRGLAPWSWLRVVEVMDNHNVLCRTTDNYHVVVPVRSIGEIEK
jgi:hypothetical protein